MIHVLFVRNGRKEVSTFSLFITVILFIDIILLLILLQVLSSRELLCSFVWLVWIDIEAFSNWPVPITKGTLNGTRSKEWNTSIQKTGWLYCEVRYWYLFDLFCWVSIRLLLQRIALQIVSFLVRGGSISVRPKGKKPSQAEANELAVT